MFSRVSINLDSFLIPSSFWGFFSCISRLGQAKLTNEELQEQYRIAQDTTISAEEKAQIIEKALKKEEARILEIEKELTRLRDKQVRCVGVETLSGKFKSLFFEILFY